MSEKRRFPWLAVLGGLLMAAGLIGLSIGPKMFQYAFLPGEGDYGEKLAQVEERWAGAFAADALHGQTEEVSLTAGEKSQGEITLYQTLGGYFEVYPRAFSAGRPLARGDAGERVMVLDGELAFLLFRDQDPLGQRVSLGQKEYEVVGVAAASQGVGKTGSYAAWIPLGLKDAPTPEILVASAAGGADAGMETVFANGAREAFGPGQVISLQKERTRGTVLLRVILIVLGCWLLGRWIRFLRQRLAGEMNALRAELKNKYPRQVWGKLLGRSLAALALAGITIAAGAGLVVWGAGLLNIFPEWVPEVLVDPEAIAQRFRELTAAAAAPVQFRTAELAEIRFWSGMLRWGLVITLLGWALHGRGKSTHSI
ncbi:MAG: ABC transporter permease [Clostridia bacterium]|nr:ABC transporter permease [Clostridia bacterium]